MQAVLLQPLLPPRNRVCASCCSPLLGLQPAIKISFKPKFDSDSRKTHDRCLRARANAASSADYVAPNMTRNQLPLFIGSKESLGN
jgi:hypothetical protein